MLPISEEWDDAPLISSGSLELAGSLSFNAENGIVPSVLGAFGSPESMYCWRRCWT